jgi:hypothetical protein
VHIKNLPRVCESFFVRRFNVNAFHPDSKSVCLTAAIAVGFLVSFGGASFADCLSVTASHAAPGVSVTDVTAPRQSALAADTQVAMQIPAPSGNKRHQPYNPIARAGAGLEGGGGGNGGGGGGGGGW